MSASKGLMRWRGRCTMVTSSPSSRRFSATSRPMNPPPHTTAERGPSASMKSFIAKVSSTVRRVKSRSSPVPGSFGWVGRAPGERMSLS